MSSERPEGGRQHWHALPELMDLVINGEADTARTDGWQAELEDDTPLGTVVHIGTYDELPEDGGVVENVATFPIDTEVDHRADE